MGSGSTTLGISYLSKYPYQCSNVSTLPVARSHLVSNFFSSVNDMDSHNNSRQSDIVLEKFWVTQCGWLRLCTAVSMGMTITNCWKLFFYRIKRCHYNNFINIRELSEQLAMDCFSDTFTTDTGKLANNISSLDEIDNQVTVSTCLGLKYSNSSPRNLEIGMISEITITTTDTTYLGHKAWREVEKLGGGCNRAVRGHFNRRLTNGKIFMKSGLFYCNVCSLWFERRTY